METKKVEPVLEKKRYEVEIYISYYETGEPFVYAKLNGGNGHIPSGDYVERYVFEIERPDEKIRSSKLKGQS